MALDRESRDPRRVRRMFGGIARHYDLLNHLLSGNLDRRWRRTAVRQLPVGPGRVLDLCGGTGDLSVDLVRQGRARLVVCCDFSHPMLVKASEKFTRKRLDDRCLVLEGDGLRLPFSDAVFDAVTVAFGIRNLERLATGFAEMHRVLRPGGRLVVLEFSRPPGPVLSRLYGFYLNRILPRVGDGVSGGGGAYGYLARTIADFADPAALAGRIRDSGFADCSWNRLAGGIVAIHVATKADGIKRPPATATSTPSERAAGSPPAGRSPSEVNRRHRR
jgi:demethylmenaquinone methyltransferase/2-methoxy-6-polyprenyl-1,4-benzoquinol methylase